MKKEIRKNIFLEDIKIICKGFTKAFGNKYLSLNWCFYWIMIIISFGIFIVGFTIAPLPYDMSELSAEFVTNSENNFLTNISNSLVIGILGIGYLVLSLGYWIGSFIPYNQQIGSFICKLFVYIVPLWAGITLINIIIYFSKK